jgi:hypothetical protein
MSKYLITITIAIALSVFSTIGVTKTNTVKDLDRQMSKVIDENYKQESKLVDLNEDYTESVNKSVSYKEEGEALVEQGKNGQLESISQYESYVEKMGKAQSSDELKQEVKFLKDLLSTWEDFDKNIKSGEKDIEKSSKYNKKAQSINEDIVELNKKVSQNKLKLKKLEAQKKLLLSGK